AQAGGQETSTPPRHPGRGARPPGNPAGNRSGTVNRRPRSPPCSSLPYHSLLLGLKQRLCPTLGRLRRLPVYPVKGFPRLTERFVRCPLRLRTPALPIDQDEGATQPQANEHAQDQPHEHTPEEPQIPTRVLRHARPSSLISSSSPGRRPPGS